MASPSYATYSPQCCAVLCFLEHFLRSVCCSGIGLGGALCVLMSGTLRAIDWRSGPTFSCGLSERHIGVSCESSPDETLTWNKNRVEEFLRGQPRLRKFFPAQRVNNVLKHGNSSLLTDDDQVGSNWWTGTSGKHEFLQLQLALLKFLTDWTAADTAHKCIAHTSYLSSLSGFLYLKFYNQKLPRK